MNKYIIVMSIILLIILTFSTIYYILDTPIHNINDIDKWQSIISSKKQLKSLVFERRNEKTNLYRFVKHNKTIKSKKSFLDYILFTLITQSTVGYSTIIEDKEPLMIIVNCVQLYLTMIIIPLFIYLIKGIKKNLFIFILCQSILVIVFTILNKISNRLDVKYKAPYNDYKLSYGSMNYTSLKTKGNKIQLELHDKLWYQWIIYSWLNCFHWSLLTQSTVGYGATWYPVTKSEKIINGLQQISIISLITYFAIK